MTDKARKLRELERSLRSLTEEGQKVALIAMREKRPLNREERQLHAQLKRKARDVEAEWNKLNET